MSKGAVWPWFRTAPCTSRRSSDQLYFLCYSKVSIQWGLVECDCIADRMPGGAKLARTPVAASRLSLAGSPLHPSSPTLRSTALPITFQVTPDLKLIDAEACSLSAMMAVDGVLFRHASLARVVSVYAYV